MTVHQAHELFSFYTHRRVGPLLIIARNKNSIARLLVLSHLHHRCYPTSTHHQVSPSLAHGVSFPSISRQLINRSAHWCLNPSLDQYSYKSIRYKPIGLSAPFKGERRQTDVVGRHPVTVVPYDATQYSICRGADPGYRFGVGACLIPHVTRGDKKTICHMMELGLPEGQAKQPILRIRLHPSVHPLFLSVTPPNILGRDLDVIS